MRVLALASLVCLGLLAAGCRKSGPPVPVGGIYAVNGVATITIPGQKDFQRTARAGMTLMSHMRIAVANGAVVVEAPSGALLALERGPHVLAEIELLKQPANLNRRVVVVTDRAEEKERPVPQMAQRYEPFDSGKRLNSEDEGNMKYFFAPNGGGPEKLAEPGPPPPSMRERQFVRQFSRPLPEGDGRRRLVDAQGVVVVEMKDGATALASSLKLPMDLGQVARVAVVKGRAKLALTGGEVKLGEGQIAEIH